MGTFGHRTSSLIGYANDVDIITMRLISKKYKDDKRSPMRKKEGEILD